MGTGREKRKKKKKKGEIYYREMNSEGRGGQIKLVVNREFQVVSNTTDVQFRSSSFIF